MTDGTPRNGDRAIPMQERFCVICGLWFGEFMACEDPDCRLETDEEARKRLARGNDGG